MSSSFDPKFTRNLPNTDETIRRGAWNREASRHLSPKDIRVMNALRYYVDQFPHDRSKREIGERAIREILSQEAG